MAKFWLVVNARSGSFDPELPGVAESAVAGTGWTLDRVVDCAESDLPSPEELDAAGVALVAIHTGDGTISSLAQNLEGWTGSLLVLPGGTMNLLAQSLHGDGDVQTILRKALSGKLSLVHPPVIELEDGVSFCGVVAGPTTAWGNVREAMRDRDLGAVIEQAQSALAETLQGERPKVTGDQVEEEDIPSLFVEPKPDGLHVRAFEADNFAQLAQHGWAWITGDFREGPHQALGVEQEVDVRAATQNIGMLVDGEKREGGHHVNMKFGTFDLNFVTTL